VKWGSDDVISPRSHKALVALAGPAASLVGLFAAFHLGLWFAALASVDMLVLASLHDYRNIWRARRAEVAA